MEHIEEHILELYVLGSSKVEEKKTGIKAHLDVCASCRSLASEMASFYADANAELNVMKNAEPNEKKALVRAQHKVVRSQDHSSSPMPFVSSKPMGRLRYFVYRHPIVAGGGTFAFGAGAVMALSLILNSRPADTNPSQIFYNTEQSRVEILNKENQKLWDFPSPGLVGSREDEAKHRIKKTLVVDLDNDGRKEFITVLPVGVESENGLLCVFDAPQHLRWQKDFTPQFNYLNRDYSPTFNPNAILVSHLSGQGKPEILVTACHRDRSPLFLARLDSKKNEIGEFWHFGNLMGMYETVIDSGQRVIMLVGLNATGDTTKLGSMCEFPVIVVIDPTKVIGRKKSMSSPGFDMPTSDAELYYIRLPLSDMSLALKQGGYVSSMTEPEKDLFKFIVESGAPKGGLNPQFDYFLSRDMSVKEVKSTNVTDRLHALLVEQGRIKSKLNKKYLDNLKDGVRYWDGKEWKKEVVKVNHGVSPLK